MDFALILWMMAIICIFVGILLLLLDNMSLRNENRLLQERISAQTDENNALRTDMAETVKNIEALKEVMRDAGLRI
jgi:cell division protein FtsL